MERRTLKTLPGLRRDIGDRRERREKEKFMPVLVGFANEFLTTMQNNNDDGVLKATFVSLRTRWVHFTNKWNHNTKNKTVIRFDDFHNFLFDKLRERNLRTNWIGMRLNNKPAVKINAKYINIAGKQALYNCDGDCVWLPLKCIKYNKEEGTLLIEEWLYNKKVEEGLL